jgi:hypothetical protein
MNFPPGTTRLIVSPRVLHLNYPLERLKSSSELSDKQAELQKWIEERLKNGGVRYYEESTYLFDE